MAQVSFYKINNSQLNSLAIAEGQIIFVQDTGDLYIDKDSSNRVQIGNNGLNLENGIGTNAVQQIGALAYGNYSFAEGDSNYVIASLSGAANTTTYTSNVNCPRGVMINLENGTLATIRRCTASGSMYTILLNKTLSATDALDNQPCISSPYVGLGDYSHIEGYQTVTGFDGQYSHAEGNNTTANGEAAHTEGAKTWAYGIASHAEGRLGSVFGDYAHIEGLGNLSGDSTVLSGAANTTVYNYDDTMGAPAINSVINLENEKFATIIEVNTNNKTITLDKTLDDTEALDEAYVDIWNCGVFGMSAHGEGRETLAYGSATHAEGQHTIASGDSSHAEGYYTIAQGPNQHVQGKYNIANTSSYAHIVGNGTGPNARSNAHTIDWSGNAWFAGNIKVGGIDYNSGTLLAPGVIPVDPSDTTNLNIWIQTS